MHSNHFTIKKGEGPVVAAAIHHGHETRAELAPLFALTESERLREEDPFTGNWTTIAPTQIQGNNSRFEVDLNRPPEKAIYQKSEDAWGLQVWNQPLSDAVVNRSYALYQSFYNNVKEVFDRIIQEHGVLVVYDIHSYNHRREAANKFADPAENPEINIGTGNLNRKVWGALIDRFMADLRKFNFRGRHLDVRENTKFRGGYFSKWIYDQYQDQCCPVAIEFKKFFMNEWTGEPDDEQIEAIRELLASTISGVEEEIEKVKVRLRKS